MQTVGIPDEQLDRIRPIVESLRLKLEPLVAGLPDEAEMAVEFNPGEGER